MLPLFSSEFMSLLSQRELSCDLPFYGSVDIRYSGFKMAVVDANLFPAGFNNLSEEARTKAALAIQRFFAQKLPKAHSILLIAEEHTRNTWYLENVRVLKALIESAGLSVICATFLDPKVDNICDHSDFVMLETATGQLLQMYCFMRLLKGIQSGERVFDAAILNNDLTSGIAKSLQNLPFPIFPSIAAGWHSRLKSRHFHHANQIIEEMCQTEGLDPWLWRCDFDMVHSVDINDEASRERLAQSASDLFKKIDLKYTEYGIREKPLIFLKSDSGTYGMGVISIEDPSELLTLNRKARNNLSKGKSGQLMERFILQEGVSTLFKSKGYPAEPCLYSVYNQVAGGFFRVNTLKSERENLNSQGMLFEPMTEADAQGHMDTMSALARISGIACSHEITELSESL